MRAYYASTISKNIKETPDGFLLCKNVPIARTGIQEYRGNELGYPELGEQMIPVHREENEVFSPAAMASFEGKPVANEHPPENIVPENATLYVKGVTAEIRRGEDEDSDKLVADLVIYDKKLIDEINAGKREISCGYDFSLVMENGKFYQRNIRGNHVAVVHAGRAGHEVAIQDSVPDTSTQNERRISKMSKTESKHTGLWGKLFPVIAKDADPADVADALETLEEAVAQAAPTATDEPPAASAPAEATPQAQDEEMPPWAKALADQLAAISAKLAHDEEDPVAKLEDELSDESAVTKPVEQMDEGEPSSGQDEDIEPGQDEGACAANDSLLKLLRTMKPVIADIKDAGQRKSVSDALASSVRTLKGMPKKPINGYAAVLDAKTQNSKMHASDAMNSCDFDFSKQQAIYDKRNPHKKERS